jgi:hypothetical protein
MAHHHETSLLVGRTLTGVVDGRVLVGATGRSDTRVGGNRNSDRSAQTPVWLQRDHRAGDFSVSRTSERRDLTSSAPEQLVAELSSE